jgi:3-hydroxyisobutyrate dehydrogenase
MSQLTKIGFLGLGAMGSRMAKRLLGAGFSVTVWNRDPNKAKALADLGAQIAGTPKSAVSNADVVISMVTDDQAARRVWLDPNDGILAGIRRGAIALESSTVSPAWITELAGAATAKGAHLLDGPVAGSRPQADSGELVFMVGGDAQTYEQVAPILAPMAAKTLYIGPLGQGALLKLAVNTLFAAQLESVAELLGFLAKVGLDPMLSAELLAQFPIVAPPIAGAARMMAAGNIAPLFTIDLIAKDLGYAIDTANNCKAKLPGAEVTRSAFQAAQCQGLGGANFSALAKLFV